MLLVTVCVRETFCDVYIVWQESYDFSFNALALNSHRSLMCVELVAFLFRFSTYTGFQRFQQRN